MALLKTDYSTKITEIEGKIPDVRSLATKTALTTEYNTKITEIENKLDNHNHDKYITTPEFNALAADLFHARLARANLVRKTNFDNTASSLNNKIAANKTKNESIENEIKRIKTI